MIKIIEQEINFDDTLKKKLEFIVNVNLFCRFLVKYNGIIVHNHYKMYYNYGVDNADGKQYLEDEQYENLKTKYLEILERAKEERQKDLSTNAYKKEKINLINRLIKYCRNHLLFLKKFFVPFSNNRA